MPDVNVCQRLPLTQDNPQRRDATVGNANSADEERLELLRQMGVELSAQPAVMTTEQLAHVLGIPAASLAQDRYRCSGAADGIPYIKIGRRVRYLRADVCRYLIQHRAGATGRAHWGADS